MIERDDSTATLGADRVTTILDGAVRRGKMTADHRAAAMNTFTVETDYAALTDADLVIEAVFEDMDVKAQVFAALDAVVGTDTVLASNTSYLDVEGLAAQTKNPERVIGLHFFFTSTRDETARSDHSYQRRAAGNCHGTGLGQKIAQNHCSIRRLRWLHWQPDHVELPPRGRLHDRGWCAATRN